MMDKAGVPLRPISSTTGASNYRLAKYLAGLLGPTTHHVKNSWDFILTLSTLQVNPDITVSFDVISLFIKVPITLTLPYTSLSLCFNHQFYEEIDGVAPWAHHCHL
jgi:hypothetical protein